MPAIKLRLTYYTQRNSPCHKEKKGKRDPRGATRLPTKWKKMSTRDKFRPHLVGSTSSCNKLSLTRSADSIDSATLSFLRNIPARFVVRPTTAPVPVGRP